ncbi:unannotated protein [freshwater metagenome]|jgi:hypothetical protein|uniref:Unannotated protein n=1 Tax=freshwater metagenome TaxID=449393 RepID=A0A6J7HFU9_9ZZZZ|nr:hypothetical protein [Actinomycetota bacterium]
MAAVDSFHITWYATGLRAERLQSALADVTPTALRYGATQWSVHRSNDDRFKFLQIVHFTDKLDFERWWESSEMTEFRAITSGWWQVPALYVPNTLVGQGSIAPAATAG